MLSRVALKWAWFEAEIRRIQDALEARKMSCTEADLQRSNTALLAIFGTFTVRDANGHEQVMPQ